MPYKKRRPFAGILFEGSCYCHQCNANTGIIISAIINGIIIIRLPHAIMILVTAEENIFILQIFISAFDLTNNVYRRILKTFHLYIGG